LRYIATIVRSSIVRVFIDLSSSGGRKSMVIRSTSTRRLPALKP
jgi:hypothetical protein